MTRTYEQNVFAGLAKLVTGLLGGGRFSGDIQAMLEASPEAAFEHLFGKTDEDVWQCFELDDRRQSLALYDWAPQVWAICWRPILEEKHCLLPGSRPTTIVPTNLGVGGAIDQHLREVDLDNLTESNTVVCSGTPRWRTAPRFSATPRVQ